MKSLESKSRLNEIKRDDFFFRGLKPKSFHKHVKHKLKAQKCWTNLARPPPMEYVVQISKALLKHGLYYDDESDKDLDDESDKVKKSNEDSDTESDMSNNSLSDTSDDEEESKIA